MSGGQQVSAWPKHSWLRLQAKGLFRYQYIWLSPYILRLFAQHQGAAPAKSGLPLSRSSIIAIAIIGLFKRWHQRCRPFPPAACRRVYFTPACGCRAFSIPLAVSLICRSFLPMGTIDALSVRCSIRAGVSDCVQKIVYFLKHLSSPVMLLT
jgi:hypothetical protein